ncbi:MAG TPA: hypothetical protein VJW77_00815 [Terriglobia bacterium]|nr:hypothetical protein [Terriglobia bacterium]
MSDKYICFLNTLHNEDSTLSGVIVTDSNGYKERWGLNEKFHPGASLLSFEQAMKVYDADYWPVGLENVESQALVNMVFDFGFNHGRETSVKVFQRWLGAVDDGIIGPATIAAANLEAMPEAPISLAGEIEDEYRKIGGPWLESWISRVSRNIKSYGY